MMSHAKPNPSYNIEDSEEDIRYQFKIVLLGDGGCGKTALTNRFCFNEFDSDTKLTIGLSFNSFSIPAIEDGTKIRIGLSILLKTEQKLGLGSPFGILAARSASHHFYHNLLQVLMQH